MFDWPLVIAASSLELVILSSAIGVVWKLSRSEMAMRAEYTAEVALMRAEHVKAIAELSSKMYQVEIWSRDEFVRKGSFEAVIARMERGFGDLRTEIASRFDRMTDSIENIRQQDRRDDRD